jgi:bifunctional DNA-binding transcriptional regulator/antitoxin component of YhaV-PrlF toxin-antitoxin module
MRCVSVVDIWTNRPHHCLVNSRVGKRGQITIAKSIRVELAISAGDEAVQRIEDRRIVIDVVAGRHRRSMAGALRDKVGRMPADESWSAIRNSAWAAPNRDRSA